MSYAEHHRQACIVSALQQDIPTKILTHGPDTVFVVVFILDKSDRSSFFVQSLVGLCRDRCLCGDRRLLMRIRELVVQRSCRQYSLHVGRLV